MELELEPGSVTWLRGTNGSGKTSLLRILAGLSAPTQGAVTWAGEPIAKVRTEARQATCYIGHVNALKEDLTLQESVAFLATLAGMDEPLARARAALDHGGLSQRREALVHTLSQGQRRRGALARLVLDELPRTWILDEPFDALDSHSLGILSAMIENNARRQGSVLLTSHQPVVLAGAREFDLEPWRCGS